MGGLDRLFGMLGFGVLMDADYLRGPGGIDGDDLLFGLEPAATDDQVVLVVEVALHI